VVTDDGAGVPAAILDGQFRKVSSTKGEGRGMGLVLVRDACEALRGSIEYVRAKVSTFIATVRCPDDGFGADRPLSRPPA
jgi:sensor histidine kinase regulating citrate/malate metabolism